jgi:succinate dehydrogenase/fumarate reductase flavoprotein subunit
MAGLAAAARARELGAEPLVLEKGDRPGGSMLLSSGVIWRHRTLEGFRAECPGGDPALQRLIVEQLDEGIEWLESLGAPVLEEETGNPRTIGKRFDTRGLAAALAERAGPIDFGQVQVPVSVTGTGTGPDQPIVLATGGFHVRLARELGLPIRGNPWSEGDGLDFALARGGEAAGAREEFYGRAMPAGIPIEEAEFVPLSQLYGQFAEVVSEDGTQRFEGEVWWSETNLVQAIAHWPGGRAWYRVHKSRLSERVRERSVADMIEEARAAGAVVRTEPPYTSVLVQATVTQTLSGIRVDPRARVVGADGLYAAGADAGGVATGGYSSGLAAALVFGRIAAEAALS